MKRVLLSLAFAITIAGPIAAQPGQQQGTPVPLAAGPTDPTLLRIERIGRDSSQVQKLAQVLLDSIGPRLGGTPNQKSAVDWAVKTLNSWGIEAKSEKYGTWRQWRRGHSHIDLMTPRVRTLEGTMLGYSPGTGGKDVTASTIILPDFSKPGATGQTPIDSADFVKWLPAVQGKFVLVSPAQPTCRPTSDWEENATPESRAAMDSLRAQTTRGWAARVRATGYGLGLGTGGLGKRLEQAGAAGVITSRPKNAWGTIEVFESYNEKAPAIGLSCEDYGLVFRLTENKQGPTIRMNLDSELMPEAPIYNVVAMIKGSQLPDEYVVMSAHFDSWDGGSGATDDGAGSLSQLEAIRILKTVYPKPKRTILIGLWAAEEHGLIGSRAFTEDHPEVLKGLQTAFNEDGGTGRIQRISAAGLPNAAVHIQEWLSKLPPKFNAAMTFGGVGTPSGGGSDNSSFSCHGLPSFGLGGQNWNYGNYTWHTQRDTYDKIVFDDLKFNASLTAMLTYLASEDATMITRERVDLMKLAQERAAQNPPAAGGQGGGGGQPPMMTWPTCNMAPRMTNPRL